MLKCKKDSKFSMIRLSCRDYGFECDFTVEGKDSMIVTEFGTHSNNEHGIEYSKEALMQIILRKRI